MNPSLRQLSKQLLRKTFPLSWFPPTRFLPRDRLAELAAQNRVPAIYSLRESVISGGLMSYGNDLPDTYRLIGTYAARIVKGEKPADLPVMQSTKFELVLNLRTAKALGIEVPDRMLALADEVIE